MKARQVQSRNFIAKLEGSDPALKDQYVVYTAHWDHLGIDPNLKGDQIFNGAADNASGSPRCSRSPGRSLTSDRSRNDRCSSSS